MSYEIIGYIAACLTTTCVMPQLIKVIKTNNTSSISLFFIVIKDLGAILWICYGILLQNTILILSNTIVFAVVLVIVAYKIRNIIRNKEKF